MIHGWVRVYEQSVFMVKDGVNYTFSATFPSKEAALTFPPGTVLRSNFVGVVEVRGEPSKELTPTPTEDGWV